MSTLLMSNYNDAVINIVALILSVAFSIILYIFKGIGIYTLSKRAGLNKLYLAYVPFANYYLLGKLIGKVIFFGKPFNNIGLHLAIITAVNYALSLILNLSGYLASIQAIIDGVEVSSVVLESSSNFILGWVNGYGFGGVLNAILSVIYSILSIVEIVYLVSVVFLFFNRYAPDRALMYSLLSIFIEPLFGIFIFVLRNNEPGARSYRRTYYQTYNNYNQPNPPKSYDDPFNNEFGSSEKSQPSGQQGGDNNSSDNPFPEYGDKK